ncbi:DUF4258 domain-containing protein [Candidatus Pacearchaeota archaeon]|nr:DUF4258 domain-containing protein [Candidatus Pacearchaeota archaeon]
MKVIFTEHAKQRMIERDIKVDDITSAIEMPDYTVTKNGKVEAYKKFGDKTLKVVYAKENKFIKIITLVWK